MICRLCLNSIPEEDALYLFEPGDIRAETKLVKIILKYFYLEISPDDSISTCICQECYEQLDNFHRYWVFVDQKQSTLRNEFLEVKCDAELTKLGATEFVDTQIDEVSGGVGGCDVGGGNGAGGERSAVEHEELLLDMKHVIGSELHEMEHPLPEKEFACSNIEIDKKTLDMNSKNVVDTLALNEDCSSTDDDIPLVNLKFKKSKSKTKSKTIQNLKRKLARRVAAKMKTKTKKKPKSSADIIHAKFELQKRNMETINKAMTLICDLCSLFVESYDELRKHFQTEHKCQTYVKCCSKKFSKPSELAEHIKWHEDPKRYKCQTCGKVLRSKKCLRSHMAFIHERDALRNAEDPEEVQIYNCHICNREFRSKKCLDNHVEKHKNDREHLCHLCNRSFATAQRVKNHIRSIHEDIHPHICDICGKKFKFKPSFERHLLEHQGIIEPTEQCTICQAWLKNKHALRLHQFRHDNVDVECKYCGRICRSRTALLGHIRYMHKTQQNLKCEFCDKTFKVDKNLKEHMAIHTGAQLYSCPHCPKEFRSKSNMYVHIKRNHIQEWIQAKNARSNDPNLKANAEHNFN